MHAAQNPDTPFAALPATSDYAAALLNLIHESVQSLTHAANNLLQVPATLLDETARVRLAQARVAMRTVYDNYTELQQALQAPDRRYLPLHQRLLAASTIDMILGEISAIDFVFCGVDETVCVKAKANCGVDVAYINKEGTFRSFTLAILDVSGNVEILDHVTQTVEIVSGSTGRGLFVKIRSLVEEKLRIFHKIIGLCTDGASVVYRRTADPECLSSSVGSILMRGGYLRLHFWCLAHRLSLLLNDCLSAMPCWVRLRKCLTQAVTAREARR